MRERLSNLRVSDYLAAVFAVDVVFLFLSFLFYKGHFLFWSYPYSYLGTRYTVLGVSNSPSTYLYSLGMLLSGVIMVAAWYGGKARPSGSPSLLWRLLYLSAGVGFFIAAFSPDDVRHTYHVVGSALFVFSFWVMTSSGLFEIRKQLGAMRHLMWQASMQVPIMIYAVAYFGNISDLASAIQKLVFVTMPVALVYAARRAERAEAVELRVPG